MNLYFENAMYRMPFKKSGTTLAVHRERPQQMTLTNWVSSGKLKQKSKIQDCFHYKITNGAA